MNFQDTILAHMRARFPEIEFGPGLRAQRPSFDPETDMDIVWSKDLPELHSALAGFVKLLQARSGLEALTRQLGVVVDSAGCIDGGSLLVLRIATEDELAPEYTYKYEATPAGQFDLKWGAP